MWLVRPANPNDTFLIDRHGSWQIAGRQGQAKGLDRLPRIGSGYACACLNVETNGRAKAITRIVSARIIPLDQCRRDAALLGAPGTPAFTDNCRRTGTFGGGPIYRTYEDRRPSARTFEDRRPDALIYDNDDRPDARTFDNSRPGVATVGMTGLTNSSSKIIERYVGETITELASMTKVN